MNNSIFCHIKSIILCDKNILSTFQILITNMIYLFDIFNRDFIIYTIIYFK